MGSERRLVSLSKVPSQRLSWLWQDRIPLGAITILEGDPEQGKSTITCDLIARVTTGRPMPFATKKLPPAGAVLLPAEDMVGAVIKPKLRAAGANLRRIRVDDRSSSAAPLVLPGDLDVIAEAIEEVSAKLVVIDPISAFLGQSQGSDQNVRRALGPLAALAERTSCAIVLLRHLTKANSANALYRGTGSIGLIAVARSVLRTISDPTSTDRYQHILATVKANLADAPSLVYRTVRENNATTIEWLGESTHTLSSVSRAADERSQIEEAMVVLYLILRDRPVPSKEVFRRAADAGVSRRTLYRAKKLLGVHSRRRGAGCFFRWDWYPPTDEARIAEVMELAKDYDEPADPCPPTGNPGSLSQDPPSPAAGEPSPTVSSGALPLQSDG